MATAFDTPVWPTLRRSPEPVARGLDPRDQRVGRALHRGPAPRPRRPVPARALRRPRQRRRPAPRTETAEPRRRTTSAPRATASARRARPARTTRRAAQTTRRAASDDPPRRQRRPRAAPRAGRAAPISGYDDLTADEIVAKLPEQPQTALVAIAAYEQATRQARRPCSSASPRSPAPSPRRATTSSTPTRRRSSSRAAAPTLAAAVRDYERRHKDRASVIEAAVRRADADAS